MNYDLTNRVILVTGGGSGIGKAVVEMACQQGAKVAFLDANAKAAEDTTETCQSAGYPVLAFACDVRDAAAVERTVSEVEAKFGHIDGLVTSAGISRPAPAEKMSEDQWNSVVGVNLTGTFLCCQTVGRRMIERKRGSIVAISSVDGFGGHAQRANYTATKFGIAGMVKSLAIDWGRFGVRVNAVAPGIVDTPLLRSNISSEHIHNVMCDRTPLARLASASDQASVCMFLLSDAASYVTGAVIPVDGGLTAGYFTHNFGEDAGAIAKT